MVNPAPNVFKRTLNFSYARSQLRVLGGAQVVRSCAPASFGSDFSPVRWWNSWAAGEAGIYCP